MIATFETRRSREWCKLTSCNATITRVFQDKIEGALIQVFDSRDEKNSVDVVVNIYYTSTLYFVSDDNKLNGSSVKISLTPIDEKGNFVKQDIQIKYKDNVYPFEPGWTGSFCILMTIKHWNLI